MGENEEKLYYEFLSTALKRSMQLELGNSRKANREFDKLHSIKDKLRELPDKGRGVLERVLMSDNVHVQLNAAAALLAIDEEHAITALQRIALRGLGLPSSDARLTIEEWRKGNLREYWK